MLRLDPAYPAVWRDTATLQFGVDAVVVLDEPAPWQQRFIRELELGVPEIAVDGIAAACGVPDGQMTTFLRLLRPALETANAHGPQRVRLQMPDGDRFPHADAVAAALDASGWRVAAIEWPRPTRPDDVETPVVLLAHHVVEPRRAAALVSSDIPHLPIMFTAGRAEIGPLVRPGHTPCLACGHEHRRERDPEWPRIASQLLGSPAADISPALAYEAGVAAARMLTEPGRRRAGHSLLIRGDSLQRRWRAHSPHEACLCQSLAENGRASAPAALNPATTTATEFALPA